MLRDPDLLRLSWEKLALNCVANPLTGLTGRRNREIINGELLDLRRALVAEVVALAAANGVVVAEDLAERIDAALSRSRNITSMLQDLRQGRPTEIEFLNGYVDRVSTEMGLDAPFNRAMAGLIRARSLGSS
jgi:2-dehydropantoate 2-reductase